MPIIIDLHRRATEAVRPIVAQIKPTDWDSPTPCAGWDLRTLMAHMIGQDQGFAVAALADVTVDAFAPRSPSIEAHTACANLVVAAFAAADPTRQVLLPEFNGRRFPLENVIGFHLLDTLVHGWDVATTLGIQVDYDEDLLAAVQAQAEQVPDGPVRTAPDAAFAPVLSGNFTGWARTLALLGRDPNYQST